MGPKKITKEQKPPADKNYGQSEPTKKAESVKLPHKTNRETGKGTSNEKNKEPEQKSKPKSLNKKAAAAESSNSDLKWVFQAGKYYKSNGNKVTLVDNNFDIVDYCPMAMLIKDGAAPVSGEHFWTANFGGTESEYKFFGITNSRWFKKKYGLFYSGTLTTFDVSPRAEFGPLIKSGDVIGLLCSFSEGHLNLYFYHNGRCLGLSFQVPASIFLPEGICPCVKMDNVGSWATITKEAKENIPKEADRVRAPVDQFGIEGNWQFKNLVDSATGNAIPLNLGDKKIKASGLVVYQGGSDPSEWLFSFWCTHYVGFYAEIKTKNLWRKTRSRHRPGNVANVQRVFDHSLFRDFPIVVVIQNPEKVVLQDQEMRVSKGSNTAIFERTYKSRKGNVFKE